MAVWFQETLAALSIVVFAGSVLVLASLGEIVL
jgi:hypothetical protein